VRFNSRLVVGRLVLRGEAVSWRFVK
jgi:hypothetical protein